MSDENHNEPVSNPATQGQINLIGTCLLILTVLLLYLLITSWPVLIEETSKAADGTIVKKPVKFDEFNLFGIWSDWAADKRLLFTVAVAGALGSMAPVLTSVATFVGNARFSINWMWWYVLRAPIGVALAILFYFIVRGGLLLPTVSANNGTMANDVTLLLNVYGIAAFSALAGMFSKQATDKLEEVFNAVFTRKEPVKRNDPAGGPASVKVTPDKVTQGKPQPLTVTGSGFTSQTKATVNGKERPFKLVSATEGTIGLDDSDVATPAKLTITVTTGQAKVSASVEVVAPQ